MCNQCTRRRSAPLSLVAFVSSGPLTLKTLRQPWLLAGCEALLPPAGARHQFLRGRRLRHLFPFACALRALNSSASDLPPPRLPRCHRHSLLPCLVPAFAGSPLSPPPAMLARRRDAWALPPALCTGGVGFNLAWCCAPPCVPLARRARFVSPLTILCSDPLVAFLCVNAGGVSS